MSICIDKHITHRLTEMPLNLAYLVATSLASSALQKKAEVSEQTHSMFKKKELYFYSSSILFALFQIHLPLFQIYSRSFSRTFWIRVGAMG